MNEKKAGAELKKAEVQTVKDKAQKIVDMIAVDKASAEEKLEAARPALEAAEKALQVCFKHQCMYTGLPLYLEKP